MVVVSRFAKPGNSLVEALFDTFTLVVRNTQGILCLCVTLLGIAPPDTECALVVLVVVGLDCGSQVITSGRYGCG